MLRDLLLGLLGFPGDILSLEDDTMRVRHDFDMLTIGERDQVNKLAPMGWFYLKLRNFVSDCAIKWENDHIGDIGEGSVGADDRKKSSLSSLSSSSNQLYLTAMSKGVEQLILDYVDDVTYLDLLIEKEGPMPLSQISSHLKKYSYTLPAIYNICLEISRDKIHGCQILDYLAHYRSGYPHVKDVTSVMLRHVRGVFVRQCLGWMLYADLDDIGKEFFINMRSNSSNSEKSKGGAGKDGAGSGEYLQAYHDHLTGKSRADKLEKKFDRMFATAMKQGAHGAWVTSNAAPEGGEEGSAPSSRVTGSTVAGSALEEEEIPFDWSSTYSLKLDMIPESHISSRLASKILLTGKAVRMLQAINGASGTESSDRAGSSRGARARKSSLATFQETNSAYKYLAGVRERGWRRGVGQGEESDKAGAEAVRAEAHVADGRNDLPSLSPQSDLDRDTDRDREDLIRRFIASSGYSEEEVARFVAGFYTVLKREELHVEVLEQLVDEIHNSVSSKLWKSLKHVYGFDAFLSVIRNTYLMGKGELYQLVLDGITAQTHSSVQSVHRANLTLDGHVLSSAAGVLGLDEEELCDLFRLRVNVYRLHVTAASAYQQALASRRSYRNGDDLCGVVLAGAATITLPATTSSSSTSQGSDLKALVRQIRSGFHEAYDSTTAGAEAGSRAMDIDTHITHLQEHVGARFALCSAHSSSREGGTFGELFREKIIARAGVDGIGTGTGMGHSAPPLSPPNTEEQQRHARGAMWLSEPKTLARGFTCSAKFAVDWDRALSALTTTHPWLVAVASSSSDSSSSNGMTGPDWSVSSVSGPTDHGSTTLGARPRLALSNRELLAKSLCLGSFFCCLHSSRQGTHTVGSSGVGLDIPYSLSAGVTVHATLALGGGVKYYLRVLVACNRESKPYRGAAAARADGGATSAEMGTSSAVEVLSDTLVGVDGTANGRFTRSVSSVTDLCLHLEYSREVATGAAVGTANTSVVDAGASVASSIASAPTLRSATGTLGNRAPGSVYYILRVVVVESGTAAPLSPDKPPRGTSHRGAASPVPVTTGSLYGTSPHKDSSAAPAPSSWDMQCKLDLGHYLRLQGGTGFAGFTASGLHLPSSSGDCGSATPSFGIFLSELTFEERSLGVGSRVSACPYTISRFPETHARLDRELAQLRSWTNIQLRVRFPAVFHIIFDSEALSAYQRLFSLIMKIRLIAHSLEKLWKTRSRLASDRGFCQLRHSMHFFISNLLYYLQVDVVDSEYAQLLREVDSASEFQQVLRAHRNFLASVLKASLVDNMTVQDAIDRVIQACLRFVAVCRLMQQQEGVDSADGPEEDDYAMFRRAMSPSKVSSSKALPVVVPAEEVESVRKDFFSQIVYLFTIMSKVENRGFMFRLDFNEYFSGLARGVHY
jgi:hypothetical protein